jgi:glucose-6-phosphate 1-epimerase
MNKQEVSNRCAIPGVLSFSENEHGLVRAAITTGACTGEIYLQGAHLTRWQPAGHEPVLFLSERSSFQPGKAIRGGIPIIFPWFGARTATALSSRTDGPSHGFARTSNWHLDSATMRGADLELRLMLEPNETSRSLGYDAFRLTYTITMGAALQLELTVDNTSGSPLQFEEALHTYLMVGDVELSIITGLANTEYFDKTDNFKKKRQTDAAFSLKGETDRPYVNTEAEVEIADPVFNRRIIVSKQHSQTTVMWNPWSEGTAKLSDMSPDSWRQMLCVETANAMENAVTIEPGSQHKMQARITVSSIPAEVTN